MHGSQLTVALVAIARPTFDVPLAQSVADSAVAHLEAAGLRVVGGRNRLLMDAPAMHDVIRTLETDSVDLLILLQASFADSTMAVEVAQACGDAAPILLWAVPDVRDGGRLRLNSLCGMNLAGHALTQRALDYDYLHRPSDDPAAIEVIRPLASAGRARRLLRGARIGVIGEHPAGFETCAYDADHLAQLFGVEVAPLALETTLAQAAAVGASERQAFLARVAAVVPNLHELDATASAGTAGVYCALRTQADEAGLSGLAVRCWPEFFTELGCAACGAMSVLNQEMCPASCEADVNGTLTSLLLQSISGEQSFITDLVSIDEASDSGVLWHCGLAPFSMADEETPISATVHSNRKLPLLFEFSLKPGRITIARLHRAGLSGGLADYQLVIGGAEIQRAPKSFGGTSGVVRFDAAAGAVLERIMQKGLEHHFNLTYGDHRLALRAFAKLIGLPVFELT